MDTPTPPITHTSSFPGAVTGGERRRDSIIYDLNKYGVRLHFFIVSNDKHLINHQTLIF